MPVRTGPLRFDDDGLAVVIVAIVAGLIAAAGPASPTGNTFTDAVLVGLGTGLVTAVGSRAPWWAAGVVAGVALAIALDPVLMVIAGAALVAALWTGRGRRTSDTVRSAAALLGSHPRVVLAASIGASANVLARAELEGPFGLSAAISLTALVALLLLGSWYLPRRRRRVMWAGLAVTGLAALAASAALGAAVVGSRHDLSDGVAAAERGVSLLEDGQFEGAADEFAQAQGLLAAASTDLDRPWTKAAAAVPVVAQHQRAVRDMSEAGTASLQVVTMALDEIDLDALRPVEGRFDLVALAELEEPLTRVREALAHLRAVSEASRSPWLVARATRELDDFTTSVDEHLPALDDALRALHLAPDMLGGESSRTYLLLFTTPSEARGLGGFVGSYAELTVDDGRLTLGEFGRAQDLDRLAEVAGATVDGQDDFLRDYGRFGFDIRGDGSGVVGDAALRNLAMSPDFPTVAEIAADLYADTTGRHVDGVVVMDPFVVTKLLEYTGPVFIPSLGRDLEPSEALPYLLRDQYLLDVSNGERAEGLAEAASQAFHGLLGGALPDPIALARDLAPLTSARRLMVWSAAAEEQEMVEAVNVSGEIPPLEGADGWSFTVSNAGGSKIDTFLDRRASYESTTDPASGVTTGDVGIELTNGSPSDGLPGYVIGNAIGQPLGTSSLWVTVYSPLGLDRLTVDGVATGVETGREGGWNAYRARVDIPPGGTVTVEAELSGEVDDPGEVVTWTQPMERDVEPR